jgi:hypothetical protein
VHARVSIFEGSPDQIVGVFGQAREQVLPRARQMDGFNGLIALGDRQSGETLGITCGRAKKPCAPANKRLTGGAARRRRLAENR